MANQEEYTRDFIDCVNELVEEFVRNINTLLILKISFDILPSIIQDFMTMKLYIIPLKNLCVHDIILQLYY